MFYNTYRTTKAANSERLKLGQTGQSILANPRKRLINLQKRQKLKDLLITKFMQKYGIKHPEIYLEEEINKFLQGEKLTNRDLQRLDSKLHRMLMNQREIDNLNSSLQFNNSNNNNLNSINNNPYKNLANINNNTNNNFPFPINNNNINNIFNNENSLFNNNPNNNQINSTNNPSLNSLLLNINNSADKQSESDEAKNESENEEDEEEEFGNNVEENY